MTIYSKSYNRFFSKREIVIRHIIIVFLSLVFGSSAFVYASQDLAYLFARVCLANFIYITLIWNFNLMFLGLVDKWYDSETQIKQKLIVAVIIAVLLPTVVHFAYKVLFFPWISGFPCQLNSRENFLFLTMSIVITLFINSIYVSIEFFNHWKKTLTEKEELKRNNITAEFETLKNQINPHFLFNCLNTLTSLIEENPKMATDFVQKLSSVYRYVLANKDKETVLLQEELDFIKAYIYLNKIRFGENLKTDIVVNADCLGKSIPTLTLQMLIENCIKHNVISQNKPLYITIGCSDSYVYVKNKFQPKTLVGETSGIGLNNIISRYGFLSDKEVIVEKNENEFCVKVPLI